MPDQGVKFSGKELKFLNDREFLLAKIEINKKLEQIVGEIEQQLSPLIQGRTWPKLVLTKSGKISKGNSYLGLPYYMLDFPRRFGKEGVFAYRTMFWWGNFFSFTLHLSGRYLEDRRHLLISNTNKIKSSKVMVCINHTPWDYHYQADNYIPASALTDLHSLFEIKPFVKISFMWSLNEYPEVSTHVAAAFTQMHGWIDKSTS